MTIQQQRDFANRLAEAIAKAGGRAWIVGGYVRNHVFAELGFAHNVSDIDIEVYGLQPQTLLAVLEEFGQVNQVGAAFEVWKIGGIDVSLPRRDSKVGPGHRGIAVERDPFMSLPEASRRRDFTINAMAMDPLTGEIEDPWQGRADVAGRRLRATDRKTFAEDPLRVLRMAQFAARFEFNIDADTMQLARSLPLDDLSPERIGAECKKILLLAARPSLGFEALQQSGAVDTLFPQWQRANWARRLRGLDKAAALWRADTLPEAEAYVLMLATACFDFDEEETLRTLQQLFVAERQRQQVLALIAAQESLVQAPEPAVIRHLAHRLQPASIRALCRFGQVTQGDAAGHQSAAFLQAAERLALADAPPVRLLMGRHLTAMGLPPGPAFGQILEQVFQAQLDGDVKTLADAQHLARQLVKS